MLKGGVIMDVTTPEQARLAEAAGACAVMALERIPADEFAAGRGIFDQDPSPSCDPATFFFYHDGHPSTAVHRIVGKTLFGEIAARRPTP